MYVCYTDEEGATEMLFYSCLLGDELRLDVQLSLVDASDLLRDLEDDVLVPRISTHGCLEVLEQLLSRRSSLLDERDDLASSDKCRVVTCSTCYNGRSRRCRRGRTGFASLGGFIGFVIAGGGRGASPVSVSVSVFGLSLRH